MTAPAPVTAATVAQNIRDFKTAIDNEVGAYEDLSNQIYFTPQKSNAIQKNWRTLNEIFSKRYATETALLEMSESIREKIAKLSPAEQLQLSPALDKITQVFQKTAIEKQVEIWQRFKESSRTLGAEKFAIAVRTSSKEASARSLPPLDLSDVTLEMTKDGLQIRVPVKKPKPSLLGRVGRALWDHKGKIALVAYALIVASQTDMGAHALVEGGQYAVKAYNTLQPQVIAVAKDVAGFASTYLPHIGSALSAIWAVPNTISEWRAGNKKTALATAALGVTAAALPHALQPDFINKVSTFANTQISDLTSNVSTFAASQGLTPDLIGRATQFVTDNAAAISSYATSALSAVGALVALCKGKKKAALGLGVLAVAAGAAPLIPTDAISQARIAVGV